MAGKNETAQTILKEVISETGNGSWLEADILRKADLLFERQGDLSGQVDFYKSLYEENLQRVKVKSMYAFLLAQSDRLDESKTLYKELLLSSPENDKLRAGFIQLLANQGKNEEALEQLDLMIKQGGVSEELLIQRIDLLTKLNRKDEVEAVIKQIKALIGDTEGDKIRISQIYIQNKLNDQAEAILKEAAGKATAQAAKEALAHFYTTNERKGEAVNMLTKALDGADLGGIIRITNKLAKIGEVEKAYASLRRRNDEFASDSRYLMALCQLSITASMEAECLEKAEDLIHLAKRPQELQNAIKMALKLIVRTDKKLSLIHI